MIVFFIPIWIKLAVLFIPFLVLVWIISGDWKKFILEIGKNRFAQILLLFWLLHLIGVLYSLNWQYGLLDVQQKLSFVIFPIILITFTHSKLFNVNNILKVFLAGSFISAIICLSNAFYNSFSFVSNHLVFNPIPHDAEFDNYFKYTRLAFIHHPSYLSMYFTFSIAILFKFIKEKKNNLIVILPYIVLIVFFTIFIFFLSSRANIIALILTLLSGVIWLITNRIKWVLGFGLIGIVGVLGLVLILSFNNGSNFINKFKEDLFFNLNPRKSQFSNAYDMRFYIWQSIPDVMSKNIVFGYGTGDFHNALNQEYTKRNLVSAAQMDYNAHNQFLESLVSLGLVGLVFMLALIAYPTYYLIKRENQFIPILFIVIIVINFLAESMLSRIAGILFFSLFYSLFFCFKQNEVED